MGKLTTHVLDAMQGMPAQNVLIELYDVREGDRILLARASTNVDGRCNSPLLEGKDMQRGVYELLFHAGSYFAAKKLSLPDPPFVDEVAVRFGIAEPGQNYHVPLIVTPWAWSTYRGS